MAMADELAAITKQADMDQLLAGMTSIAQASWKLFQDFQEQGFSKSQAFEMTKQWQFILFSSSFNQNKQTGGQ